MIDQDISLLVKQMRAAEQPAKAVNMAAYLKDKFKCLGVKSPVRNEIQREWFKYIKDKDYNHWDVVYHLWELPEREFQYIAVDYLKKLPLKKYQKDDYKYLEELITTKSWWETVDGLATNAVSRYLIAYPEQIPFVIKRWRESDDMWLNRTTLIFQLKYAENTDFELMKDLIVQFMPIKEFFIQKAIGWALRQYSKTDPDAVRAFIEPLELSSVARREAIKYI